MPATPGAVRHAITRYRYAVAARTGKLHRDWRCAPPFAWFSAEQLAPVPLTTIARKCLALLPEYPAI